MFIPPMAWPDRINRGPSIGWPVFVGGSPRNVVRRFLDDKEPRYQGLPGRGIQIWPDVAAMQQYDATRGELLLVTGMRDAANCIAAGFPTWTTTGGVGSWIKNTCPDNWAPGRRFSLCFDAGEEQWAEHLADYLIDVGAKSVRVLSLTNLLGARTAKGIKDLSDLAETESLKSLRKIIRLGRVYTEAR
jgi:hypothetical protein